MAPSEKRTIHDHKVKKKQGMGIYKHIMASQDAKLMATLPTTYNRELH